MPPDSGNLDSLLPASSRFMLQNQKNKRKKNHVNHSLDGHPPLRDLRLFPTGIKHQRKSRIKHVYISPSCSFFECFSTTISLLKNRSNQYIYCLCACLLNTWKEKVAKNQQKKKYSSIEKMNEKESRTRRGYIVVPDSFFCLTGNKKGESKVNLFISAFVSTPGSRLESILHARTKWNKKACTE